MDVWINDILYTTGMVLFGVVVALVLSVVSSMLILQESWPSIRRQVMGNENRAPTADDDDERWRKQFMSWSPEVTVQQQTPARAVRARPDA